MMPLASTALASYDITVPPNESRVGERLDCATDGLGLAVLALRTRDAAEPALNGRTGCARAVCGRERGGELPGGMNRVLAASFRLLMVKS